MARLQRSANLPLAPSARGFIFLEVAVLSVFLVLLALLAQTSWLDKAINRNISRTKADMRSIATALSAYAVDNPGYPPPWDLTPPYGRVWGTLSEIPSGPFHSRTPGLLTTPIAYLKDLSFDPFRRTDSALTTSLSRRHTYYNFDYFRAGGLVPPPPSENNFTHATALAGAWLLYSLGPDKDEFNTPAGSSILMSRVYRDYDPTNGTISAGNIFCTEKSSDCLGVDPYFYSTP